MSAKLIAVTQPVLPTTEGSDRMMTAEQLVVYCARVSSPQNQTNHLTAPKLLSYCLRNKHWSVFEQASFTVEIKTSRAIAQQILRHRSFSFQEFSQRYAKAPKVNPLPELRKQGATNRQGGEEIFSDGEIMCSKVFSHIIAGEALYDELIEKGVAMESARMILPLCTPTTLYMTGTVRSWIHYLQQRLDPHTQKEHREIAKAVALIFWELFPNIERCLDDKFQLLPEHYPLS